MHSHATSLRVRKLGRHAKRMWRVAYGRPLTTDSERIAELVVALHTAGARAPEPSPARCAALDAQHLDVACRSLYAPEIHQHDVRDFRRYTLAALNGDAISVDDPVAAEAIACATEILTAFADARYPVRDRQRVRHDLRMAASAYARHRRATAYLKRKAAA